MRTLKRLSAFALLASAVTACGESPTEPEEPEPTNKAPDAEIFSPEGDAVFEHGEEVIFQGEAQDPEDGALTGGSLVWTSDLDGEIGTGEEFSRSDLSVGRHQIILKAEDSEGKTGQDGKFINVAQEPEVDLGVHLPRPDLSPKSEVTIADGEAFVLRWEVSGGPHNTCRASGDWSGSTASSGTDTTGANPGPATFTYVLECENALGADSDTADVTVGAPGEVRARSNRTDITDSLQVKLFYVTCEDCIDRKRDLDGSLENNFKNFQDRFERQTGRKFRVDTYIDGNGTEQYDITFVLVGREKLDDFSTLDAMRRELTERGLYDRPENGGTKILLQYYDGEAPDRSVCGNGGAHEATVWIQANCSISDFAISGHEVLHAVGLVDNDAPNATTGLHVTDHERDLMHDVAENDFIVDYNCDDYYWDSDLERCAAADELPANVKNLAESPFLMPKN